MDISLEVAFLLCFLKEPLSIFTDILTTADLQEQTYVRKLLSTTLIVMWINGNIVTIFFPS